MSIQHRTKDIEGVQFHPESVLTEGGHQMLAEWLVRCGDIHAREAAVGLSPVIGRAH
jgi:para-aminobenzoate synthetase component 2